VRQGRGQDELDHGLRLGDGDGHVASGSHGISQGKPGGLQCFRAGRRDCSGTPLCVEATLNLSCRAAPLCVEADRMVAICSNEISCKATLLSVEATLTERRVQEANQSACV
jgi:hypothetical protein